MVSFWKSCVKSNSSVCPINNNVGSTGALVSAVEAWVRFPAVTGLYCVEFACSPCACWGSCGCSGLPQPQKLAYLGYFSSLCPWPKCWFWAGVVPQYNLSSLWMAEMQKTNFNMLNWWFIAFVFLVLHTHCKWQMIVVFRGAWFVFHQIHLVVVVVVVVGVGGGGGWGAGSNVDFCIKQPVSLAYLSLA